MKKGVSVLLFVLIAAGIVFGFSRRSMVELNTNTGCGPCTPCNDWLDDWYPDHLDEVCILRYHTSGPSSADPFYMANPTQNVERTGFYSLGYVPLMIVDGRQLHDWSFTDDIALDHAGEYTPLEIGVFASDTGVCLVKVKCEEPTYGATLNLICVLNEDTLYYTAPNGQTVFFQTMRYMLPDWDGQEIVITGDTVISAEFDFTGYLSYVDDLTNCWFTVMVQDFYDTLHHVIQCNKRETDDFGVYFHQFESEYRQKLVAPDDTVSFDIELLNAGAYEDQYDVWFEADVPPGWHVEVVADGSPFDSARVSVESFYSKGLKLDVSPMGDIDRGFVDFYIKSINEPSGGVDTVRFNVLSGGNVLYISQKFATDDTTYYKDLFTDNGVDFDLWSVKKHGYLSDITEPQYEAVVWQGGPYVNNSDSLTLLDRTGIENFLNSGGKLLITSASLGRLHGTDIAFYDAILGADYDGMESAPTGIMGTYPGTPFSGMSATLSGSPAEGFLVLSPAQGALRLNVGPTCGLIKEFAGGGKLVYISFKMETITNEAERDDFWNRVLTFFGGLGIDENAKPDKLMIARAYPNPFNSAVSLNIDLPAAGEISVEVYDIAGRLIEIAHHGMLPAGKNTISWNAEKSPSGIYLIRIESENSVKEIKSILIK